MNAFFYPETSAVAWREYGVKIDLQQQCQRDLLVLLPYMHDDYEAFGGVKFDEIERYYMKAIDDGCVELTKSLMKYVIYKLARNEPLGQTIIDYIGSSFHNIVTTGKERRASNSLRLRKSGKGQHKKLLERKRWLALSMHIYILFLLDDARSITKREANAEASFLKEAHSLRSRLGNLKSQTPEQKLQVAELEFLSATKDILGMAKRHWNFANLMWDSFDSIPPNRPDGPPNSYEIIRQVVTADIELTPEGILQSYLRLCVSAEDFQVV